jgi:hypothetical protein
LLILCELSGQSAGIPVEMPAGAMATQASAAEVEPATNDNINSPTSNRRTLLMRIS